MPSAPLWTLNEIAQATDGLAVGTREISGIVIDSREAGAGDLFVPLKDKRDGHDFIDAAFKSGASAALSEIEINQPHVRVKDSFTAMKQMAIAACQRSGAIRVGVTGSVGKTSIKEMIAIIFEAAGPSHKSVRSFNNHWGVPLTMARMPQTTQRAVFEMGMNHAGELTELSNLLQPDLALISLIAPAHLAHFENVDAIAAAKAEIFDGLKLGGTAVLNRDDAYFESLSKAAQKRDAKIVSFGKDERADLRLSGIQISAAQSQAKLRYNGEVYDVAIPATGEHWLQNAAAAIAVAIHTDIAIDHAIKALAEYTIPTGRGAAFDVVIDGKFIRIIDESYNANPTSMRAAINSAAMQAEGRLLAVLGDMFELGKDEVEIHASLAPDLEAAGVSRVIFRGENMRALRGAVKRELRGALVQDAKQAYETLRLEIESGDMVLIKGSNASGLGELVHMITSHNDKDVA